MQVEESKKRYIYTARDQQGKIVKGVILAEDELSLANKISAIGYFLTSFRVSQKAAVRDYKVKMAALKSKEVLRFTFQLATLVDAGMPLLDSLRNLAEEAEDIRIKNVLSDIRYRVESGNSFKEAIFFHSASFSSLYAAFVGAGEATGKLSQILEDLSDFLEWQSDLKSKIKEAATYPCILFVVMTGVVVLLVTRVIPMFKPIFEQIGADLPLPTQIILNVSSFVSGYWYIIIGAVILLILGYGFYNSTEKGRYQIDSVKLRIPLFGELVRKITLARFTHTFSLCFKAGIDLLASLDIAKDATGNARIAKAVARAKIAVNVGDKLASSLQKTGEFPSLVIRMVNVGEQSGSLGNTLNKVAGFYDKDVATTIKKIFISFEPIMIILMGVVVGGIALAMFLPMFQMVQKIGG